MIRNLDDLQRQLEAVLSELRAARKLRAVAQRVRDSILKIKTSVEQNEDDVFALTDSLDAAMREYDEAL